MNIREISIRTDDEIDRLSDLWERSVRATHDFLSGNDIRSIAEYVPDALRGVSKLIVAEDDMRVPIGFIGINDHKIEMLFVLPERTGQGIGRILVRYAVDKYCVSEVCVNEQNPKAIGFYERMGFKVYDRAEIDEQGDPFPLLYMRLDL